MPKPQMNPGERLVVWMEKQIDRILSIEDEVEQAEAYQAYQLALARRQAEAQVRAIEHEIIREELEKARKESDDDLYYGR